MFIAEVIYNQEDALRFFLQFPGLKPDENTALRVQLVDADKFFMPSFSGFCVIPVREVAETGPEMARAEIPILQILEQCGATNLNSRVMEFVLCHQGQESFVYCSEQFSQTVINTKVVSCSICLGTGKNLIMRMEWKIPKLEGTFTMGDDCVRVQVNTALKGQLILRRRIEFDIVFYDRQTSYKKNSADAYDIGYEDLIRQTEAEKTLFGLYYKVNASAALPSYYCRVVTECEGDKRTRQGYEIMACRTKDMTASISVRRNWGKTAVLKVERTATEAVFSFKDKKVSAIKLQRRISITAGDGTLVHHFVSRNMETIPGNRLPLIQWNHIHQKNTMVFRVLAHINGTDHLAVTEQPFEIKVSLAHQNITVKGSNKEITVEIEERHNKIRLGILGTCMTRWAFSRKYTDAYRDLYDVVFAHFWPSVFALTGKAEEYPEQLYADYPETETEYVRREYEKTSLAQLQEANCEYVLIDFFVDAIHGPRKMKNGNFIGYKGYAKDFYQDYLMFDTEKYFLDDNGYFENWKKHADRLIEHLQTTMPENRIILATGGLTHNFLAEDGSVKCFDGMVLRSSYMTKHSINALDYLWDKMNAYFIERLPNAQVLDMRRHGFLAHDKNPANVRPYHFVQGYYRTMSAEVSRLILWDKQNH